MKSEVVTSTVIGVTMGVTYYLAIGNELTFSLLMAGAGFGGGLIAAVIKKIIL
jgi:hypothetical protein